MGIEGEKRYALLLACNDSEYVKEVYGGYFNVFVAAFGEEGERWDLFRVVEGDFPDMDELQNYDGFIVSGSPYDAYANDFWILKLCFLLKTLDVMRKKYVKEVYGGYFNVFVAAFGEQGERWDLFRVVEGDFPDMDELQKYDGFIVSGSPYDAYANDFWILKLCFLLKTLDVMRKKVLCRAFGGKVGKAYSGWDIGLRKVRIVKDFSPCGFLDGLDQEIPPALSIIECHQDEVWEVPEGAEVIAFSDKTGVEMFTIGDHILGIQGHPEYTKDILNNLIDRLLTNGCIEKGFAEDVKSQMEIAEPDRKCWEKICKIFLKGRWNQL
ncbi:hypothetical protein RHGRI_009206 [Rhododendron griersonianum]|uniref:Glutamine amidotransferase domain-containing protein n=1 Tax=Rhododendron griersonianum TaxID=479676 RepID=A0AAV6L3B1_9ERIC|nr:hypothetical protein RHGRI_009206 [Rhododendron griersonianum]